MLEHAVPREQGRGAGSDLRRSAERGDEGGVREGGGHAGREYVRRARGYRPVGYDRCDSERFGSVSFCGYSDLT